MKEATGASRKIDRSLKRLMNATFAFAPIARTPTAALAAGLATAAMTLGTGCTKLGDGGDDASVSSTVALAEAGVQALAGEADAQAGSSFAEAPIQKRSAVAWLLKGFPAWAANCARAVTASCSSGVRSLSQSGCDIFGTTYTLSGAVTLTYSQSGCTVASNNDTVVRTFDYSISGPRGASVRNFSSDRANALAGTTIGGGGRITTVVGGWNLDVLGKHKVATTAKGATLFDVSIKTSSAIGVTGSLGRASRVIDGGQLDVYHNLAGVKASFVPSSLTYSSGCCHPTGGSLTVTYFGNLTGSATVSFSSCGSATVTSGGTSTPVTLSYCE